MAYNSNRRGYRKNYSKSNQRKKSKYSKAEQLAFNMGQQQRVAESIEKNKNSRVYESFCKGYNGVPKNDKTKPLY